MPLVSRSGLFRPHFTLVAVALVAVASAQTVNKANWRLADRFSPEALRPFVYSTTLTPAWVKNSDVFWYSWKDSSGIKFWLVDAKSRKKTPLFDSAHMAAVLSMALKRPYDTTNLPITTVTFDEKIDDLIHFTAEGEKFDYDLKKGTLKDAGKASAEDAAAGPPAGQGGFFQRRMNQDFHNWSPDKKAYVYAQDYNLYYVAVADGKDQPPIQLTKDGEKYYSFGSRAEEEEFRQQQQQFIQQQQQNQNQNQQQNQTQGQRGRRRGGQGGGATFTPPPSREQRVHANVTWSKDSKRFFVERRDERKVKDLYLVNSLAEPRPTLMTYKYAMPGEVDVPQTELFAFDPGKKALAKVAIEKYKDQTLRDVHWQDNTSDSLRFVRRDRLQRNMELCEVDLKSNQVRTLLSESVENSALEAEPIRYVKPGGDMIWWSQRDGWGHFYLYSNDGKLKNQITSGPFRATSIVDVDADKKLMWFHAVGRESKEDAYYQHLYRINLDGTGLTLLDQGDADHNSWISKDHKYAVDLYSRVDQEPRAVLRDDQGKVILDLEHTDLTKLVATGWKMPETFTVKAADGVTDIYGNMWKPFDFDPNKKYPIIANVYPGPQTESVSSTFTPTSVVQELAQLGFVVIQIGNRGGNPNRSAAYENFGYFNLRDYGLADKKAGIEQLAERYPWIDLDRVGIFGHSGGGFMTAAAMMLPPYNEFFKVGVSSSGNHDNNIYNQNWAEEYHGLREVSVDNTARSSGRTPEYEDFGGDPLDDEHFDYGFPDAMDQVPAEAPAADTQFSIHVPTNAELAANLKGHLLLVHGDMDNNVHYAGTVRLVNALMRANKRFDYLLMPGKPHGYGDLQPYFTQRLMEYFSEYLLGDRYGATADMGEHR